MTELIMLGGSLGTLLLVAFVWIWVTSDLETAAEVVGFTLGAIAAVVGVVLLWAWIATAVTS